MCRHKIDCAYTEKKRKDSIHLLWIVHNLSSEKASAGFDSINMYHFLITKTMKVGRKEGREEEGKKE